MSKGRPIRFATPMVQTTVRLPSAVLEYLKEIYGGTQKAIDAMVIIPVEAILAEQAELEQDAADAP